MPSICNVRASTVEEKHRQLHSGRFDLDLYSGLEDISERP
jgi:hypothetical protein